MCIAIFKPKDAVIDEPTLRRCWGIHKDGAGFCYVENNELVLKKGFMKEEEFLEALKPYMGFELLIHFRRSSPGMVVNEINTHPFKFTSLPDDKEVPRYTFAVIHNGRLDWRNDEDHSDTSCFVHDLLEPWFQEDPWVIDTDFGRWTLERCVRYGTLVSHDRNKMAIMRYDNVDKVTSIHIVNGKAWNKTPDGIIYSNYDWEYKAPVQHQQYPNPMQSHIAFFSPRYLAWRIPDKNGWSWVYGQDRWFNQVTKQSAFELVGRSNPYSFIQYSHLNREEYVKWLKTTKGLSDADIVKLGADFVDPVKDEPKEDKPDPTKLTLAPVILIEGGGPLPLGKKKTSLTGLDHLDTDEIGAMVHETVAMWRRQQMPKAQIKNKSQIEKVEALRMATKLYFSEVDALEEDYKIDEWILGQIKLGTFRRDLTFEETRAEINMEKMKAAEKASIMDGFMSPID